jgi:Sigma-70, region 4
MATFDQLTDEQRAIVELVLQQGKSYAELSDMLGLPEARVRALARDALVDLAPISARGVEEDWRGQLADYVLGQQAGPEATATRGHLRRSEAARSWTRSLLDSLEQLYPDGDVPAIPEGDRGRDRGGRRGAVAAPAAAGAGRAAEPRALTPEAAAAVRRRRLVSAAGVGILILLAVLLWPIGLLTGGDDDDEPSRASSGSNGQQAGGGQEGPISTRRQGTAIIAEQNGKPQILVTATGLEPSTQDTAYQVWLYNSNEDRRSLGATATDQQGNLQAGAALPANYEDFKFVDLTSVTVQGQGNNQSFKTGPSALRGLLELRDKPVTRGQGKTRITLLGEIRLLPLPE